MTIETNAARLMIVLGMLLETSIQGINIGNGKLLKISVKRIRSPFLADVGRPYIYMNNISDNRFTA